MRFLRESENDLRRLALDIGFAPSRTFSTQLRQDREGPHGPGEAIAARELVDELVVVLVVVVEHLDETVLVRPTGELDLATAPELERGLDDVIAGR